MESAIENRNIAQCLTYLDNCTDYKQIDSVYRLIAKHGTVKHYREAIARKTPPRSVYKVVAHITPDLDILVETLPYYPEWIEYSSLVERIYNGKRDILRKYRSGLTETLYHICQDLQYKYLKQHSDIVRIDLIRYLISIGVPYDKSRIADILNDQIVRNKPLENTVSTYPELAELVNFHIEDIEDLLQHVINIPEHDGN